MKFDFFDIHFGSTVFEGMWSWGRRKINFKISNLAYDLLSHHCWFYNVCCLL